MPVPQVVADGGLLAKFVVDAQFNNAVDIAQALPDLKRRAVLQPAGEGVDDLLLGKAVPARATHRQDERETKFSAVVTVKLGQGGHFLWRAMGQTDRALLAG